MRPPFFQKTSLSADPFSVYGALHQKGPGVLLESARVSEKTGRYSVVACRPYDELRAKGGTRDPFRRLKKHLRERASENIPGLPPFTGGALGVVSYEAKRWVDRTRSAGVKGGTGPGPVDDLGLPEVHFFFFDEGVVLDHAEGAVYFFAKTKKALKNLVDRTRSVGVKGCTGPGPLTGPVTAGALDAESSMTRAEFLNAVRAIQAFIKKGDIFQANLSQRFLFPFVDRTRSVGVKGCTGPGPVESVYARLRRINPSSFFGIFDAGDYQILSGSPERLVKLENGILETRPIAGTRARGATAEKDRRLSLELLLNDKERAEHIMLVDLERNDMGRVAEYGSVTVDELMAVEDYSHVKHIVSNVRGVLRKGCDAVDALKAFFPGGTITGAPKIRCLEILDSIEPVARGPYTGSMGYFSFTGNMDWNIIIRSLLIQNHRAALSVGAGIVADSVPEKEYDETLYKALALLTAVFGKRRAADFLETCRSSGMPGSRIPR
ncbi:MAG: anthranilate synthase component I family protein [Candidatus Omnitrophica bacterium]|nr:anthranilate synthase component I family protein [Candidatus Omnitrophota bacterium]